MTGALQSAPSSYVLETSAAINLERSNRLGDLPPPGNWVILPSGVAGELHLDYEETPVATKKWAAKGKIAHFTSQEESLYRKLILHPAIGDGEGAAIAMAYCRNEALVIDEKKTGEVWRIAQSYGITCMVSEEFFDKIKPRLPGF